jgi:outer membrane protein TolC
MQNGATHWKWNNCPVAMLFLLPASIFVLLAGGCDRYDPQPLSSDRIEQSLAPADAATLRIKVSEIHHPTLRTVALDPTAGLTPDEAAVLAVVVSPALRAQRDERATSAAELLQAGILPNPQLAYNMEFPVGGSDQGAVTAYGVGVNWDINALITRDARVRAAREGLASVDLDIAWQEWQTAQAARLAVYDLFALRQQLALVQDVDHRLRENLTLMQSAVDQHQKTVLDLAAAEAASRDAHAAVLTGQHDVEHQRLMLNRALGFPPETRIEISSAIDLPDRLDPQSSQDLTTGLETRRLDLLALQRGYNSQEETVRAAILGQFPKINLGLDNQRDNTNVKSIGFSVGIELPIFDRNQGAIATERATRQKLYDEYVQRIFEARSDIAIALADIQSIGDQIADDEAAVPSLQRLVDTYKSALNRGNLDVLSYYAALNDLTNRRIDILKLKQALTDTRVALEIASAEYLPDGAAAPTSAPATAPATQSTEPNP